MHSAGDRIAVISKGSLICCGSFEFLRQRFGKGHKLTLVTVDSPSNVDSSDGVESVTTFLMSFVRSVILDEVCGQELRYILPLHDAGADVLTQLFQQLEENKSHLGIESYGTYNVLHGRSE